MALDEFLLESAVDRGQSTLRWYRWSEATVSLGYFQKEVPPEVAERFAGVPVVRRLSGGGAILHHHELTYALALAGDHPLAADPRALYDLVHQAIIAVLQPAGVPVALRGAARPDLEGRFLCFSRGDPFDVVCAGFKVLGSAQRRRKRAVLQHGSLLIRRSEWTPEFPGICDLTPRELDLERLAEELEGALADLCAADRSSRLDFSDFSAADRERVGALEGRISPDAC